MVHTVNGSLIGRLLLTSLLGSRRSLLLVSAWAGDALLAAGLLRSGNNTAVAIAFDLTACLLDLPEGVAVRGLHDVY